MMSEHVDYLEEERKKIWQAITDLRKTSEAIEQSIATLDNEVNKKTSDYEADAKRSAKQAAYNRTRTKTILQEANDLQLRLNELFEDINRFQESIPEINSLYVSVKEKSSKVDQIRESIQKQSDLLEQKHGQAKSDLEELTNNIKKAQEAYENIEKAETDVQELYKKITIAHSQAAKRNIAIKDIHREVFGYSYEDEETGESKIVEGTKDALENAYDILERKREELAYELDELRNKTSEKYEELLSVELEKGERLRAKIRGLLPDAMTAGLSHAYERKRKEEEVHLGKARSLFNWSIFFLSATAVIPVVIGIVFLGNDKSLEEVILKIPRIVVGILPIYIPLFWLAMAANKSVKLSKRLIEEYSHKEALSKTFEGLSKQVDALDDDNSKELRARLLYNIISASSENPGNLIKDFSKSDNPIFDVFDKSAALSESLKKLSFIPGIEVVLQKINKEQKQAEEEAEKTLEQSILTADELEEEPEEA
ncbi:chromosome segregation protein SMC [Anaerohalosphaera lusitana]|uniref:Chromosome segregation protein SMC n=1 Tax=Anaerohalosphaera lusitana TaxID=1936003 RepID=A0A1U9NPD4_9BACT|nr:hypothetical protein [Anaerohalosphaera lusitana]AQT69781.1 chromosome segregation protein SMC [Anaerohalosphaera lusitana]